MHELFLAACLTIILLGGIFLTIATNQTYQTKIIGLKGRYKVKIVTVLTNTAVVEIVHGDHLEHKLFLARLTDLT